MKELFITRQIQACALQQRRTVSRILLVEGLEPKSNIIHAEVVQYPASNVLYKLMTFKMHHNCCYILFTKLPRSGDSEWIFWCSSQAAVTCPSVYHTRWRLHTVPLITQRQAVKLSQIQFF